MKIIWILLVRVHTKHKIRQKIHSFPQRLYSLAKRTGTYRFLISFDITLLNLIKKLNLNALLTTSPKMDDLVRRSSSALKCYAPENGRFGVSLSRCSNVLGPRKWTIEHVAVQVQYWLSPRNWTILHAALPMQFCPRSSGFLGKRSTNEEDVPESGRAKVVTFSTLPILKKMQKYVICGAILRRLKREM